MSKLGVAIIGPGNIGTDLLFKAQRSEWLRPLWSIGVVEDSEGLCIARERGLKTSHLGLESVVDQLSAAPSSAAGTTRAIVERRC